MSATGARCESINADTEMMLERYAFCGARLNPTTNDCAETRFWNVDLCGDLSLALTRLQDREF